MKGTSCKYVECPGGNQMNNIINVNNPQRLVYTEFWRDASDTALIENSGVAADWGCNLILVYSIIINERSIARVIPVLLHC